ncbi:hypothetical protein SHKM778_64770 [Streptomyces sp. KM77-8]|uniref:Uncharacterized protein n=1 Tax=Streptomyces haneummycinicus TaxID=3074435 RepID=A0AAT9HRR8_9ACTN
MSTGAGTPSFPAFGGGPSPSACPAFGGGPSPSACPAFGGGPSPSACPAFEDKARSGPEGVWGAAPWTGWEGAAGAWKWERCPLEGCRGGGVRAEWERCPLVGCRLRPPVPPWRHDCPQAAERGLPK